MPTVLGRKCYDDCMEYLAQYHPQSLPIYYLLYGICKNNLPWKDSEFVVDQWPQPNAIVCRPISDEREIRSYERDPSVRQIYYTVTLWSRDSSALEKMLLSPDILAWSREIMFHGVSCPDDRLPVENACNRFGLLNVPNDRDVSSCEGVDCTDVLELRLENLRPCSIDLPEGFTLDSLQPHHAEQINSEWSYGGCNATRLYLEAALDPNILGYPSAAVLDETGKAVSYILYEPEGNMAMGYTAPVHRGKGFFRNVNYVLAKKLFDQDRPNTYVQILPRNLASKATYKSLGATTISDWHQHWIHYSGPKNHDSGVMNT